MIHLDHFEGINSKTPWAPKNLIDRAAKGMAAIEGLVQQRIESSCVKIFSSEVEALLKLFFALVQEKTLGEGRNHVLVAESLRASLKGALTLFESFGIVVQSIPLQAEGILDLSLLKGACYPTTMACVVEPYDLITGVEQPIEQIAEILGPGVHLHVISRAEFGWQGIFPGVDSAQIDSLLFAPKSLSLECAFDLDQVVALTTTFQEELNALQEKTMHAAYLRRFFERAIEAMGGRIFFKEQKRHSGMTVFGFDSVHGELLAYYLCQRGIFVSIGGGDRPALHAHLARMGFDEGESATAVHACFTAAMDERSMQETIEAIEECLRMTKRAMQGI
jgi:cysteine sulfinate desulfinase/cysteine desulfurase-like protein